MLLVLKGHLKVLNTPYLVYSTVLYCRLLGGLLFKGGVYSRAASDRANTVFNYGYMADTPHWTSEADTFPRKCMGSKNHTSSLLFSINFNVLKYFVTGVHVAILHFPLGVTWYM